MVSKTKTGGPQQARAGECSWIGTESESPLTAHGLWRAKTCEKFYWRGGVRIRTPTEYRRLSTADGYTGDKASSSPPCSLVYPRALMIECSGVTTTYKQHASPMGRTPHKNRVMPYIVLDMAHRRLPIPYIIVLADRSISAIAISYPRTPYAVHN